MTGTAPPDPPPTAADVFAARARLRGVTRRTPLQPSPWLSEIAGVPVHLKLECWQRTGSFKLRGAFNAIGKLDAATRERGLTTASAGNHGLAVAVAAALLGATATIFVPASAPGTKKRRIRRAGADLREVPGTYDDAAAAARLHADESGAHLVHAFDHPDIRAGQGTVGLEIVEALPEVVEVVVPVGGGGLAAGVGAALRALAPGARTWGVQSTATTAMYDAFRAGQVVPTRDAPTLCDGLAGETEPGAYRAVRDAVHGLELVEESAVAPAIRALFLEEGVVAEGAGAVGVAALIEGLLPLAGPTAVVVSGGNIDGDRLARILD
jgi:threonine dehydratase